MRVEARQITISFLLNKYSPNKKGEKLMPIVS